METGICMACFHLHSTFPSGHISLSPAEPRAGNRCPKGVTCPVSQRKCDRVGSGTQVLLLLRFLLFPEIMSFPLWKYKNGERERSWVADWAKKLSSKLGAVVGSESAHIKIEKGRCVYIFEMTCRNHWFGSVETSWMRHTACRYAKGRGEPLTSRATFWGQRNEHIKPDDLILYTLYLTQGSFCMNVPSYLIS